MVDCYDTVHGLKGCLLNDGGCCNSGDISKTFGAGTDFVMLDGIMAGYDESGGTLIEKNRVKYRVL